MCLKHPPLENDLAYNSGAAYAHCHCEDNGPDQRQTKEVRRREGKGRGDAYLNEGQRHHLLGYLPQLDGVELEAEEEEKEDDPDGSDFSYDSLIYDPAEGEWSYRHPRQDLSGDDRQLEPGKDQTENQG